MSVFVLGALRTPVSTACPVTGIFRDSRADSLAGEVIAALNAQLQQIVGEPSGFPDEVIWGVSRQEGEQGYNLARQAVLEGGLPVHIPALTVCRNCASGLDAILLGQALIESGRCEVLIAGGVAHMGHVPLAENFPGPNFIKQFGVDASRMVACVMRCLENSMIRKFLAAFRMISSKHRQTLTARSGWALAPQSIRFKTPRIF